jgi:glycosyltransferase involved in cell wall biosynthesis
MLPKIRVLMSTYNGTHYIESQIKSLFNQNNVEPDLLVRDDGSTDGTTEQLEQLSEKYGFEYILGKNIGASNSFRELVISAGEYDFYAFCDQDDVWLNDKLSEAILKMNRTTSDIYFSNVTIVDSELIFIENCFKTFDNTMFNVIRSNKATGCTIVFSKEFRNNLIAHYPSNRKYLHDWWTLSLGIYLGFKIFFDHDSYILYRQHDKNVVGAKEIKKNKLMRFIKGRFDDKTKAREEILEDLKGIISSRISEENHQIVNLFLDYKNDKKSLFLLINYAKKHLKNRIDFLKFYIQARLKKI